MRLITCTLAERPELGESGWPALDGEWPPFMHLASGGAVLSSALPMFAEYVLLGVVATNPNTVVARAVTVPFQMRRNSRGGPVALPDGGWDEVIRWVAADQLAGHAADTVASLEVVVRRGFRHRGWGAHMIMTARDNARRLGYSTLVAPVRPVAKHREPHTPMTRYVARFRADSMPADPWLRAHARLGGRLVKLAPVSTVIALDLATWRRSTGLPFERSGPVEVPGALVPVHASIEHDYGVYVEPGVWVRHDL